MNAFGNAGNWLNTVASVVFFITLSQIFAEADITSDGQSMTTDEIKNHVNKKTIQSFLEFANGQIGIERLDYMLPESSFILNDREIEHSLPYSASASGNDFEVRRPWGIGTNGGIVDLVQPERYGRCSNFVWTYYDGSINTVFTNEIPAMKFGHEGWSVVSSVNSEESRMRFLTSMSFRRFFELGSVGYDADSCRFTGRWVQDYKGTTQSLVLREVDEKGRPTHLLFQETNYAVNFTYAYEQVSSNLPEWMPCGLRIWCANSRGFSTGDPSSITFFKPGGCKSDILTNTSIRRWLYTSNKYHLVRDIKSGNPPIGRSESRVMLARIVLFCLMLAVPVCALVIKFNKSRN